ncbi:MAG: MFS transporter [Candidatus Marinimicrobia bacterium]|nr:MFS transporter [Candidatus Neomarinimicrobiota bacterium]
MSVHQKKEFKTITLIVSTMAAFLTPFMSSSINIALPSIGKEFSMNAVEMGWVATSYLLASAMFLLPFGRLADIYGRKKVFLSGTVILTLSCLFAPYSPSTIVLIIVRMIQGFGGAMIFGTGVAILTSVFPSGKRGKVLGINAASVYLGLSTGPVLGGFLTEHFGWRSIFYVNIPIGLTIILLVVWRLKGEWSDSKGEKFDLLGAFLYIISLFILIIGLSDMTIKIHYLYAGIGTIGFICFLKWELWVNQPLLNIRLFRNNTVFMMSNVSSLINYAATYAIGFMLSLYLQYIKGINPEHTGLVLIAQPFMMAFISPLAGRLSDRIEPRIVASTGMAVTTLGLILFAFIQAETSLIQIIAILMIIGTGLSLFASPNTNAIMSSVEKRFYGVASGTLGTMRLIGQMLSMGSVMLIVSLVIGREKITPVFYPSFLTSMKIAFSIFSFFCFIGIFCSLARGKVYETNRHN